MDEILWCHNSNETSSAVFSYGTICFECSSNYFNTEASVLFVVRILNLWMKHYIYIVLPFKQTISAVLSHGIILKFSM